MRLSLVFPRAQHGHGLRGLPRQDLSNLAWALARLSREAGQIFEAEMEGAGYHDNNLIIIMIAIIIRTNDYHNDGYDNYG